MCTHNHQFHSQLSHTGLRSVMDSNIVAKMLTKYCRVFLLSQKLQFPPAVFFPGVDFSTAACTLVDYDQVLGQS